MNAANERLDFLYKFLIICALSIALLILAKDIFIPLAFAGLIAIAVLPLVKRLEKKIRPIGAIVLVLLGTLSVLGIIGYLVVNQMVDLVQDLPNLQERFTRLLEEVSTKLTRQFHITSDEQLTLVKDAASALSGLITGLLLSTGNLLSIILQVPIYTFLFLVYRDRFRLFFESLFPKTTQAGFKQQAERVVQGYISGQLLVIALIVTLDTLGLLLLGIDYAFFFGLLSGILVIIPYIGNFIGGSLPVLMALITKDSVWYAVGVIALYAVIHFIEGNIIAPRIMGSKVSVNALAAILGLLVGGKILGIAGMILAVPALGMGKVLLSYSHRLKPFIVLLDDKAIGSAKDGQTEETHTPEERCN
jgi:predicted PurR-regulated permease PerM